MLDRIEVRRQEQQGGESRVVADVRADRVRIDVTFGGKRTKHEIDAARFSHVAARLEHAVPSPLPAHSESGAPIGHEVIISAGMTQSVFRWVASSPATWEPIAAMASDFLALARDLSDAV
jgi:hypothetical protein